MAESELKVIEKAKALVLRTVIVTSNLKNYPKKYRFTVVDKMQNKAMGIYESLFEANRTDIRDYKRDRLELQTRAIAYCDELMFYIEMSHEIGLIRKERMDSWSGMVADVKHMAIAWRTKDKKR